MRTYADLLIGKIFDNKEDVRLKSKNDSIFWWESNQIWGYISKESLLEVVASASETTWEDKNIKKDLIFLCEALRMNADKDISNFHYRGITVAEFIGIK